MNTTLIATKSARKDLEAGFAFGLNECVIRRSILARARRLTWRVVA
jgi:hypothetical protein